MMCPVWKPVISPPKLDHFCHLSSDAQLVMAGIYRQFKEQQDRLEAKRNTGQLNYYQQLYERRFGGLPGMSVSSPQARQTVSLLPCPLSEAGDSDLNPENVTLDRDKIDKNFYDRSINSYNSYSAQVTPVLFKPSKCSGRGKVTSECKKEITSQEDTLVSTTNSMCGMGDCQFRLDRTENDSNFVENGNEGKIDQRVSGHMNRTILTTTCSSCNDNVKPINKSPGNFVQPVTEAVIATKLYDQHPSFDGQASKKPRWTCSISARLKQHMTIRKESEMQLEKEEQKRNAPEVCKDRPAQKRESDPAKYASDDKKRSKLSQFAAPFKKRKMDLHQISDTHIEKSSEGKDIQIYSSSKDTCRAVYSLSDVELELTFDNLLKSSEILISLVFKNGSTQLREISCSQAKKKLSTANPKTKKCSSEVQYIAAYGQGGDAVWLFSGQGQDPNKDSTIRNFWKNLLANQHRKICCDAKMLFITLMKNLNIEITKDVSVFDPVVGAWLIDPESEQLTFQKTLSMVCLAQKECVCSTGLEMIKEDLVLMSEVMKRLYQKLRSRNLWDLYCCVETKLIPLLSSMECRSLKIDMDTLLKFSDILKRKLQKLEQKAYEAAGHPFLINSPAQLRQVLFEELKLDKKLPGNRKLAKTSIGHQISTSENVLNQLTGTHLLPGIILEYRQIQKLKSTYVEGVMSCIQDGYIFTHWDQTSAVTGRLSSYQPNIQAIPKSATVISDYTDNHIVGKECDDRIEIYARDSFVSHEGWSFLAADFQQIELRLLAHLADDPTLLQIFNNPTEMDIFAELTSQWLCKPLSLVTAPEREQTKRIVYSVMYGAGKERLAEYLKMSANDAKAIMDSFLVKFPVVHQFSRKCVEFCQKNGFTTTIFKRQRLIPNIKAASPVLRAQAERQAVNFCVQGSAADLCKAAMIQVENTLKSHTHLNARLVVQIHDELLLEVLDEDLNAVKSLVQSVMEDEDALCGNMVKLKVPIKVSLSSGKTWGHMSPLDEYKFS